MKFASGTMQAEGIFVDMTASGRLVAPVEILMTVLLRLVVQALNAVGAISRKRRPLRKGDFPKTSLFPWCDGVLSCNLEGGPAASHDGRYDSGAHCNLPDG